VAQIKKHMDFAVNVQEPMVLDEQQIGEDSRQLKETLKYQRQASDQLQDLIDALLPELEPRADPKNDPKEGGGGGGGPQPKGGFKAQDGIPPVAQLKVLRAEQLRVNALTKAFAEQHPDLTKLTPEESAELEAIQDRQARLLRWFGEMRSEANEEGKKQ
jgi:hypothetical protein